jgi:diadenosine tetraphosphatase ApaH/serine/threonine PP2A family protein phosphatase
MKIIIFSDVHGNIDAFEAFVSLADNTEHERIFNLGDTVGYGAGPNECVELVRARNIPSVTGNHDDVVLGRYEPTRFNPDARRAIQWSRSVLKEQNFDYLRNLIDFIWIDSSLGKALLVHGSPVDKDEYVMSKWNGDRAFSAMKDRDIAISFVAHTHKAGLWIQDADGAPVFKSECSCAPDTVLDVSHKVIVNVGSVGQPRDGNPQGCFVVWDDVKHSITFHRFDYPVQAAQQRIRDAGLPRFLADRLEGGY